VNSRSGVDQRSSASQHPMTDIYYGTLGFGSSRLSILSILLECQVSDCLQLFPSTNHMTPGMPRGDPRHPGDIIIPHHIHFFGTSWLWTSENSNTSTWGDFFLPLNHEPFLLECQVSRPWDLTPHIPCDQWLRLTPAFRSSLLNANCNTFPPEYQVSGLHDLAPHIYWGQVIMGPV
jgi:hypothetical protein